MEVTVAVSVLSIVAGGVAAQYVAALFRVPGIVLLLALGFLLGPVLHVLQPSASFGPGLQPIIGLAVAIVVFEGGLALDFRELRAAGGGVVRLTAVALPINFVLGALAARFIGQMEWGPAAAFGAILVVTGPTVILPLLRGARLERRSASFLKWEAILNDPVGAILTVLILEIVTLGHADSGEIARLAFHIVVAVAGAAALGIGSAFATAYAFRRDLVPEVLKTPVMIALALVAYVIPNLLVHDAGLIGATLFGIALANLHVAGLEELRRFKESLVVLLVSCLFVVLTADLDLAVLGKISLPILLLTGAMVIIVRPVAIAIATLGSDLTWRERLLVGWIAPRGIVAAAVAGVAGRHLTEAGHVGGDLVQPTVFAVIAATVLAHGFTLKPFAKKLELSAAAEGSRLAIVGASDWSRNLAMALHNASVPVLLIDTYPGALAPVRHVGVPVLQAELLSLHGGEALEEQPPDYLLAATQDELYNALLCSKFAPTIGRERVFQIMPSEEHLVHAETGVQRDVRGKVLTVDDLDFQGLGARYAAGGRFTVVETTVEEPTPAGLVLMIKSGGGFEFASPEHSELLIAAGDRAVVFTSPGNTARSQDKGPQSSDVATLTTSS